MDVGCLERVRCVYPMLFSNFDFGWNNEDLFSPTSKMWDFSSFIESVSIK